MHSKHLLKYIVILALLLFSVSVIPAAAQEGGEESADTAQDTGNQEDTGEEQDTGEEEQGDEEPTETATVEVTETPTDTVTAEPTETPTEEPTETATVEVTETPTDTATVEPTETPTDTATVEPTETVTVTVTVEPTETVTATVEPTETPTVTVTVEPTETVTATVEPTVTPTATVEPTITPTVVASPTVTATVVASPTVTATLTTADDVESAAVPGSFTSQFIAIANLNTSGAAEVAQLGLDEINGAGGGNVPSQPIFPGGVSFIRDSALTSNGQFSGILSSGFPAAAAVLTINSTAKAGDAYPGLSSANIGKTLFALGILNKHANFETSFYCQNAGSTPAPIKADFFQTGVIAAEATVNSTSLAPGAAVKWNITDANIQSQWPGGNGKFGYAKFTSANNIACVAHIQRTISPYAAAMFAAVPQTGYQSTNSIAPGVFNGHGSSSQNNRGYKFNTGIAIVNPNAQAASVTVQFRASNQNYTKSCTANIPGGSMVSWIAALAGTAGNAFSCTGGPLAWPGPTVGTALITSNRPVMGLINSNKYDTPAGLASGYSSLVVARTAPTVATTKAVCPLAFNKNPGNDWISGIQAVNVGSAATNVSFKLVKAGLNPAGAGNSATMQGGKFNNIAAGAGISAVLYQDTPTIASFEGAVFVQSSGQPIAVVSSNTNYNTLGTAALYDCINY